MKTNKEDFIKAINEIAPDEKIILSGLRIEWIEFDTQSEGYSWAAKFNYAITGTSGYIFPLAGGNMVKHFKTLAGAKRNAIKYFDYLFN